MNDRQQTLAMRLEKLRAELFWAQRHASDLTMAEHNRKWFEREAERLRAEIAKAQEGGTGMNAQHMTLPRNPYSSQGSLQEAWQRGFEGRPMLAYPGSNYAKAYAEGQVARATLAKAKKGGAA